MSDIGRYDVPEEFQDEDKWFFLTKRQLIIIVPVVFLVVAFSIFIVSVGFSILLPIVIIVGVLLIMAAVVVAFVDMPDNWYLYGGGMQIEKIIFRVMRKRMKKDRNTIYTKHYDRGNDE